MRKKPLVAKISDAPSKVMRRKKLINESHLKSVQPLTKNQEKVFEYYSKGYNLVLDGTVGSGKLQPLTEPILTPNGWTTMGELKINDYVIGQNGKPSQVLKIFEGKGLNIYRVEFTDGTWTECCEDHLWKVSTQKMLHNGTHAIMSLKDMLPRIENAKIKSKGYYYSIPVNESVQFEPKAISLDPYLLGWLLGDGYLPSKTNTSVFISTWNVDTEEIYGLLVDKIPMDCKLSVYDESPSTPNVRRISFYATIKKYLDELGLLGKKSLDKFVPKEYLYNTIEVRKAILAGLLDTDGSVIIVDSKKKKAQFSTSSKQLLLDVAELIRSLGGIVNTREINRKEYKNTEYSLSFRLPFNPFNLSRKAELYDQFKWTHKFIKKIKSATYIGKKDGRCLLVDNIDHLYLTRDYIVTHNTMCAVYIALKEVLNSQSKYDKLIIARSAVATRDIGFLPGTLEEKIEVYELPYKCLIKSLFSFEDEFLDNVYDKLKEQNSLEFISTSYIRGTTLDNCILLVDEFQSLNFHELNSIITRMGINSKIIFSGDPIYQSDLQKESEKQGAVKFLKILNLMNEFKTVHFSVDDIVRSSLVKSFIIAKEKLNL